MKLGGSGCRAAARVLGQVLLVAVLAACDRDSSGIAASPNLDSLVERESRLRHRVDPGATTRIMAHKVRSYYNQYEEREAMYEKNWLEARKQYAAKGCLEDDPDEEVQMEIAFKGGCAPEGSEERAVGEKEWAAVKSEYDAEYEHIKGMQKMINAARKSHPFRQFFRSAQKEDELEKTKKRGGKLLKDARKKFDARKKEDGWSV